MFRPRLSIDSLTMLYQEIHIDAENKIVTTPAFMCDTKYHEIHDGVGKMVKGVLDLVAKS